MTPHGRPPRPAYTLFLAALLSLLTRPASGPVLFDLTRKVSALAPYSSLPLHSPLAAAAVNDLPSPQTLVGGGHESDQPLRRPSRARIYKLPAHSARRHSLSESSIAAVSAGTPRQLAYCNDFEDAVGPEWALFNASRDATPVGTRHFLRGGPDSSATLRLFDLPAHTSVQVSLDLFIIGDWVPALRFPDGGVL